MFVMGSYRVDVIPSKGGSNWRPTRPERRLAQDQEWITNFVSTPADLVFGHGDLWEDLPLVAKRRRYRLSGLANLYNAGSSAFPTEVPSY